MCTLKTWPTTHFSLIVSFKIKRSISASETKKNWTRLDWTHGEFWFTWERADASIAVTERQSLRVKWIETLEDVFVTIETIDQFVCLLLFSSCGIVCSKVNRKRIEQKRRNCPNICRSEIVHRNMLAIILMMRRQRRPRVDQNQKVLTGIRYPLIFIFVQRSFAMNSNELSVPLSTPKKNQPNDDSTRESVERSKILERKSEWFVVAFD